jgi:hypothetical protein
MKDRDHGRIRIHCSTMREAGTSPNRKTFYLPVDIAGPKLKDMQAQKVALQAQLAEQPSAHGVVVLEIADTAFDAGVRSGAYGVSAAAQG